MIKQYDTVALISDITDQGLKAGDVGAVVEIFNDGEAYEVEFVRFDGRTQALLTLKPNDVSVTSGDWLPQARSLVA